MKDHFKPRLLLALLASTALLSGFADGARTGGGFGGTRTTRAAPPRVSLAKPAPAPRRTFAPPARPRVTVRPAKPRPAARPRTRTVYVTPTHRDGPDVVIVQPAPPPAVVNVLASPIDRRVVQVAIFLVCLALLGATAWGVFSVYKALRS